MSNRPPPPGIVIQPCNEACGCYRRLERWPDYGLCENPCSPLRGYPVHPGRDCRHYATSREPPFQRDSRAA